MRLTVLALPLALIGLVAARGHTHPRDYVDELSTREILEDLTTRELIDELSDRLERRATKAKAPAPAPKVLYTCAFCGLAITEKTINTDCPFSTDHRHGLGNGKKGWDVSKRR
ncbi:ectomycorrhizas-regulated small secreted protein [Ephemerocybe angulata]|uniref:Ectomycorrhizas-regulated small secreted protein n=1 Tax=Ephemerocybe angulata TaxID=980116 RepID=A0A8H6M1W2_9AGAR|nr:ectomycorrhizas-regulated small secreted protein [Tulosesus angulatus]